VGKWVQCIPFIIPSCAVISRRTRSACARIRLESAWRLRLGSSARFLSVGVVDSGEFKGEHALEDLRARTEEMLGNYVALAIGLGVPATSRMVIGTEAVAEAEDYA
jgi:hypothetical protein